MNASIGMGGSCSPPRRAGDVVRFRLAFAHDERVRDLVHLGLADLVPQLFVAVIALNTESTAAKVRDDLPRERVLLLRHRDDVGLHRGEPRREGARVMLHQDAEEPLQRSHQRAVDHDRAPRRAVIGDVGRVEPLGMLKSTWIVEHCQERPSMSLILMSIFGP